MNPLSLVADCDNVSLTGDAVDPGSVRWVLEASRDGYEVKLLEHYVSYVPWCRCGPNGSEAVPGAQHKDGCRKPDGDPPEGIYCIAAVLAEYLGATLHVSGPLRHGWPPRPIQEMQSREGVPVPGTQVYAVPESANVAGHLGYRVETDDRGREYGVLERTPPPNAEAMGIDWSAVDPAARFAVRGRDQTFTLPSDADIEPVTGALAADHRAGLHTASPIPAYCELCRADRSTREANLYPAARQSEPEPITDSSSRVVSRDASGHSLTGTGPHPHNASEEWRDDGKCIWKSCGVWRNRVWGVLVWPERTDATRRVDEYADQVTAARRVRDTYGRNVRLVWRHEGGIKLYAEAIWHDPDCEGAHGDRPCDTYQLGPVRRVPYRPYAIGCPTCGRHTCPGRDGTTPCVWSDTSDVLRCTADTGAMRLGGDRTYCGKPLPCPEHTITPATQAPTDIAQPPANPTQGQAAEMRTQSRPPRESDVRAPAHEGVKRVAEEAIDRLTAAYPLRDACLVVVYGGLGTLETGLRVCGLRRPCPTHEPSEVEASVEHDETCQHDDAESADAYCGFDYPHQPHVPMTGVPCPGKQAPSIYDGPRQSATTTEGT